MKQEIRESTQLWEREVTKMVYTETCASVIGEFTEITDEIVNFCKTILENKACESLGDISALLSAIKDKKPGVDNLGWDCGNSISLSYVNPKNYREENN